MPSSKRLSSGDQTRWSAGDVTADSAAARSSAAESPSSTGTCMTEEQLPRRSSISLSLPPPISLAGSIDEESRAVEMPTVISATEEESLRILPAFLDEQTSFFLIYLNTDTFLGERGEALANELRYIFGLSRGVRADARSCEPLVKVIMVHERRATSGGCEFDRFLHVTPKDLVIGGLYKPIAISLYPGAHEQISYAEVCKAMGLKKIAPHAQTKRTEPGVNARARRWSVSLSISKRIAHRQSLKPTTGSTIGAPTPAQAPASPSVPRASCSGSGTRL